MGTVKYLLEFTDENGLPTFLSIENIISIYAVNKLTKISYESRDRYVKESLETVLEKLEKFHNIAIYRKKS